jgi:CBS domain-containing protein
MISDNAGTPHHAPCGQTNYEEGAMLREITVRKYMTTNLISFHPSMSIYEAIRKMMEHKITAALVMDDQGHLIGVLSEADCLRVAYKAAYHEDLGGTVKDYMSTEIPSIGPETSIPQVTEMFLEQPYRSYPVMEHGRVIGVISRVDVLRALIALA